MATKERNIDIWLILVIILLTLSIGGGLWLTGQSILARLDSTAVQTKNQLGRLSSEVFELRKQVQNLEFIQRKKASVQPAEGNPPSK